MNTLFEIIRVLFYIISGVVAAYFLMPVLFFLIHLLLPKTKGSLANKYPIKENKEFDFAAIITAHQDTRFIAPLVDSFLQQTYQKFMVYVVADDCDISDLHFDDDRIVLLKPQPAFHAKIHSIKFAVDSFKRAHDVLIIFDSDNLVHPFYLATLDNYFKRGFKAVQTHMLSKNTDTVYAKLDSIGHIYNTFMERKVKMELHLSSAILGLGIALDVNLYKEVMFQNTLGGFDKKLQAELIKRIPQLAFAEDAIVYDEKVETGTALEKQRTRWIYTYFKYFPENWNLFFGGLKTLNFNRMLFGFSMLRPPLFITLALAFVLALVSYFVNPVLSLSWAALLLAYVVVFVLVVLTQSHQKGMAEAIVHIPKMVFRQVLATLKIKKASKDFLKTEHKQIIYIKDILKNEVA